MRIFFFAGKCIPIEANSLEFRPLGGTETALIRVAEVLERRGHEVTVFSSHKNPATSKPRYLPISEALRQGNCDYLVAVQDWWPVFLPLQARKRFYWTGDGPDQYLTFGIGDRRVAGRVDALLAVSNWHAQSLAEYSGFPLERIKVVKNGVNLPFFEGSEERNPKRLIFTSAPYRGLRLALHYFEELKKLLPDLELHVFGDMKVYDREEPFKGPERVESEQILELCRQSQGCYVHGNTTQALLAREYMKSALFFYPATVPETFCITAIEAQAAGCPVITSAIGALPETVGMGGLVVHGPPGSPNYSSTFIEAAHKILTNTEIWKRLSDEGLQRVQRQFSWEHVADRFEELIVQ